MKLAGKRIVVTGSSRGIGAETCRELANEGALVIVNANSDIDEAILVANEINLQQEKVVAFAIQANIAIEEEAERLINESADLLGGVDILINNAGIESTIAALDLDMAEWDRIMSVNLRGAFICARAAARKMIAQGSKGVILNNSSIHESVSRLGLMHYCVSKSGLRMMSKALALEWAEYGIRVLGIAPGAIETQTNKKEIAAFGREKFEDWIPLSRLGNCADIAKVISFLVSEDASYITGTTLEIDGGYALNLVRYDPRQ